MKTYTFVVNPVAGNGRAAQIIPMLRKELARTGALYEVQYTTHSTEAVDLARSATGEVVVAVGGDGTINEVANGLSAGKTLGIIPAGSGNDLIKSLQIPRKPMEALRCLLEDRVMEIDAGTVLCTKASETDSEQRPSPRLFTNGVGVGFDASVAIRKSGISFIKGTAVYVLAVLDTLRTYRAPTFSVQSNGFAATSEDLLLVAIGNGRCAGGGFYLTPDAELADGVFDVTMIRDVPVRTILHLMPRVMRGKHIGHPAVKTVRTDHVVMESETPFNVHADGEIVGRGVNRVEVALQARRINVIAGKLAK